ncbi:DUF748 domain-containing protein [Dyadobacter sandarakinus]|uniref:DUF748 domain-containing protein n=1 Tax=Dyadobacter sandarakinus TaxID=2747268 RepID=A0ABX7IC81_9BACT|nr:DUF748 domain-containing protein [Dyadobacter sandarakinus]QRR02541.1 DUF748 domain-containing protein [Dyadobacter sandarakinus]
MKKSAKIMIGVVVLLIIARLLLPYFVLRYVNKVLADMDGYTGHISDVDIHLIRGAYQIDSMNIRKINGKIKEPFISIPQMDLAIQWEPILKGKLVAEVKCTRPEVNFAFSDNESASQTGKENDWTQVIKDLLPIEINRFVINDGRINLTSIVTQPRTDLSLNNFNLEIENIRNVEEKGRKLPSPVHATGDMPGFGGKLIFDANMMLLKQIPDFDYNMRLQDLQLVKLNNLSRQYGNIDFEKGSLTVVSEMEMKDGKLEGYLKPLTKDMKIFKLKEENRNVGQFFRELLAETGSFILENKKRDQVATRIPLKGDIGNISTDLWPIVINVLRNAYVEAFKAEYDSSLNLKDTIKQVRKDRKEKRKEKKEARKEKRKARKEKRKEAREARKKD